MTFHWMELTSHGWDLQFKSGFRTTTLNLFPPAGIEPAALQLQLTPSETTLPPTPTFLAAFYASLLRVFVSQTLAF